MRELPVPSIAGCFGVVKRELRERTRGTLSVMLKHFYTFFKHQILTHG